MACGCLRPSNSSCCVACFEGQEFVNDCKGPNNTNRDTIWETDKQCVSVTFIIKVCAACDGGVEIYLNGDSDPIDTISNGQTRAYTFSDITLIEVVCRNTVSTTGTCCIQVSLSAQKGCC